MAVSEPDRHELYQTLEEKMGKKPAETFMNLVATVPWTEVATKADLADLRAATQTDVANLRADMKADVADLQKALRGQLRSFVTIVAVIDGVLFAALKVF